MKRVLIVTNMYPSTDMPYYGVFIKEQVDELKKNSDLEVQFYYINSIQKGKLEYLKSILSINKLIKKYGYDIIHIHYGLSGLFLLFVKPCAKVFLTLHGADILKKQGKYIQVLLTKLILKKITKAFILNKEMERIMLQYKIKYTILPCGIDPDFFNHKKRNFNKDPISKTILFPGNPNNKVKNFSLFKEVIRLLKTKSPNWNIIYKCIFNLTRLEVLEILSSSDCLCMTSYSEGSPQIIKEALACNLSVVSVPVGDVPEIISNIPNCYISMSNEASELCSLLIKSLNTTESDIRNKFLEKEIYDNRWVARKITYEYFH